MKYVVISEDHGTIYADNLSGVYRTRGAAQRMADRYNHAMSGTRTAHVFERPDNWKPAECDIFRW